MTDVMNGQASETEEHYRRRAGAGDTDAMYNLGVLLERRGRQTGAATWYRRAAKAGDVDAMFNLGGVLEGAGRVAEARDWYQRAAESGDVDARSNLALLEESVGHPDDYTAASQAATPTTRSTAEDGETTQISNERPKIDEQAHHPGARNLLPAPPPPPPPVVHDASNQWGQPAIPPFEPRHPGRILRRVLIGWNVLAVIWLIAGIANAVVQSHNAAANCSADLQQTCQSAFNLGAVIGVGIVVFFWVAGDIILGGWYFFRTRRNS